MISLNRSLLVTPFPVHLTVREVGLIENSFIFLHSNLMETCAFIEYSTALEADIGI
jgi:hypothetical protein